MSAVAIALLAAAAAPPSDKQYLGLWEGAVGPYPVVACFTELGDDTVQGSYYYRSRLTPIGLSRYDRREGQWVESADNNEDFWTLGTVAGNRLTGRWHDGAKKTLPITLKRRAYTAGEDDWGGACLSPEYFAPRAFTPKVTAGAASIDGWSYEKLMLEPPAHMADLGATSFAYAPAKPGDKAIIAALRRHIPDGKFGSDAIACMLGALPLSGTDGFWDLVVEPTYAGSKYIGARLTSGDFCGGAHPNYGLAFNVFDRITGKQVGPYAWFGAKGFAKDEYDSLAITPDLRAAALRHVSAETEAECREYIAGQAFWSVGLSAKGMIFAPEVAHAMTPCREELVVPWNELAPFLSGEGRKARDAIR